MASLLDAAVASTNSLRRKVEFAETILLASLGCVDCGSFDPISGSISSWYYSFFIQGRP
ncbi:MAG TPA: hypothetical protein VKM69_06480 [Natronoarchaeum rubrum]|nr:hypothetical protein [Natronoarchaeum rubrum]